MFSINIDLSDLNGLKDFTKTVEDELKKAKQEVAVMGHAKAVELAAERLKSRRSAFINGLSVFEEDGIWIISLAADVRWIEDGMPPHNMLDDLLKSKKAKRAKDGSTYLVVPFAHGPGQGPATKTSQQLELVDAIKKEMKQRKIPWSKVERDDQGRPKMGRLHSFNAKTPPKKGEGPGQGQGAVGAPRQGPTGIPYLQGVSVYQRPDGKGGAKRSVMTFRVASSKHQGEGRWDHPGLEPVNIIDDTYEWLKETLEQEILPQILGRIVDRL